MVRSHTHTHTPRNQYVEDECGAGAYCTLLFHTYTQKSHTHTHIYCGMKCRLSKSSQHPAIRIHTLHSFIHCVNKKVHRFSCHCKLTFDLLVGRQEDISFFLLTEQKPSECNIIAAHLSHISHRSCCRDYYVSVMICGFVFFWNEHYGGGDLAQKGNLAVKGGSKRL